MFEQFKRNSGILMVTLDPFDQSSVRTVLQALPEWAGYHAVIYRPVRHWSFDVRDSLYNAALRLFELSFGADDALDEQVCITGRVSFRDNLRIKVGYRSGALIRIFSPETWTEDYLNLSLLVPVIPKFEPITAG